MAPILGCIADDFTGGTDLANTLVKAGMRVVQTIGAHQEIPADANAIVVSLKCRSNDPQEAVAQCVDALGWLQSVGCTQFFYKYCSTFDSTSKGNIGPVSVALLNILGGSALVCPAFPENKRTIYKGYLYVGDVLLHESPMRDHPVTPMRDAQLLRLFADQAGEKAGLVPLETVRRGAVAVHKAVQELATAGIRFVVPDAVADEDLLTLGEACKDMRLVTGGSGIAMGLPHNYRADGRLSAEVLNPVMPMVEGKTCILSASCSTATRAQLQNARQHGLPMHQMDPLLLAQGPQHAKELLDWALQNSARPFCVYASESPEVVAEVQNKLGREKAGALVEEAMGQLAVNLHAAGVNRFIVAGGETSGAVVSALKATALCIGPQIAPGVPWTGTVQNTLALALKSGNFGGPDFFADALNMLTWPQGDWNKS